MSKTLKELHEVLATELLNRVKDPEAKSSDLNVARQFLKDNGIEAIPADNSPLKALVDELHLIQRGIGSTWKTKYQLN